LHGIAVRNLRVLLHDHLDVVLVSARWRVAHDLVHEIDRGRRADATDDAQLEYPALPPCGE
jgi:hypothetical protein